MNENETENKLNAYIRDNLAKDPDNVRKVTCLVWFDKLSFRTKEVIDITGARLLVHTTPCHAAYDPQTVINTLVQVFGYGAKRAHRRVVSGVLSRRNKREGVK